MLTAILMTPSRIAIGSSLLLASATLIGACNQGPPDLGDSSSGQEEFSFGLLHETPEIYVLVVDDAPTPEAAELRTGVADSVSAGLRSVWNERWSGCGSPDPAMDHPGDLRILVLHPSAPDDVAMMTPVESPALAWITKTSKKEEIDPVVAAATDAMDGRLAKPGEVYRPLRAVKRAIDLLTGSRPPESDGETTLVSSLPPYFVIRTLIASTRNDEDSTSVGDLIVDCGDKCYLSAPAVIGPSSEWDSSCAAKDGGPKSRLEIWAEVSHSTLNDWPCLHYYKWQDALSQCCMDCAPTCHDRPLAVDESGRADCQLFIDQPDLDACDPSRGWKDPEGGPKIVEQDDQKLRRCEIVQLSGADLDACRADLQCTGCQSGFCVTEVPELDPSGYCGSTMTYAWPLRFIGGALDASGARLSGACLTGPVPQ